MNSMRPPANAIDQAYLCAKADQASKEATGGTVLPASLLEALLDRLDEEVPNDQVVSASAFLGLLRRVVRRATQGGEAAIPFSTLELHVLATLAGAAVTLPQAEDNVILFPLSLQQPDMIIESEPA